MSRVYCTRPLLRRGPKGNTSKNHCTSKNIRAPLHVISSGWVG
uniref:Uncharacterized protein n=1 Tax=Arundo donax TaxID=35708 RepID=A0A0A9H8M7_ARUDO